ncbi:MAG: ABC transporter permease, partial [Stackebrandtia sp.]
MNRTMLIKTRRDMRRRFAQFAAIAAVVMVGVVLFVASYDAYRNLETSYDRTYDRLNFADLTATGADPERLAEAARDAEGVAAVATRTQADLPLHVDDDKLVGRVAGMPADAAPDVNRVDVVEGDGLDPADPDGVLVEKHTAETFGLSPGDTLEVFDGAQWRTLTVRGVAVSAEYLWPTLSRQEALVDPRSFAVVFAAQSAVDEYAGPQASEQTAVLLDEDARDGDAEDRVAEILRDNGADDVVPRVDQASNATLADDVEGFEQLAVTFPALFLAAAGIAAYVLITRLVRSERKIIATFLASGAARGAMVRHYLGHGVVAGAIGGVLGVLLGAVATAAVTRAYTGALDIPDTVVENRPGVIAAGLGFGVAVGLFGALA